VKIRDPYVQAYWVAEQGGDRSNVPLCLEGVVAATAGDEPAAAARLLGAAHAVGRASGVLRLHLRPQRIDVVDAVTAPSSLKVAAVDSRSHKADDRGRLMPPPK
jgi:hypothetical protein